MQNTPILAAEDEVLLMQNSVIAGSSVIEATGSQTQAHKKASGSRSNPRP
jgi:hypothetical protein